MEICVTELALCKKVKAAPTKKWIDLQTCLETIAGRIEYLRAIAANVTIIL